MSNLIDRLNLEQLYHTFLRARNAERIETVSTTSWSIAPNKVGMTPVAAMTISTKQTNKPIKTDCLAIFKNLSSTLSWLLFWTTET